MTIPIRAPGQLADLFRLRRKHLGLSQTAVAQHLGISQERVSAIERGPGRMTVEQLIAMLQLLELRMHLTPTPREGASDDDAERSTTSP